MTNTKILPASDMDINIPKQSKKSYLDHEKTPHADTSGTELMETLFRGYHMVDEEALKQSRKPLIHKIVRFLKTLVHRCWSITVLLPTVLVLQILLTASVVFTLTYVNSINSVNDLSNQLVKEVNDNINNSVRQLLGTPSTIIAILEIETSKQHIFMTDHGISGNFTEQKYRDGSLYALSLLYSFPSAALVYYSNDYGDIVGYEQAGEDFFIWEKWSYGRLVPIDPAVHTLPDYCRISGGSLNLTVTPVYKNGSYIPGVGPTTNNCGWDARIRPWYMDSKAVPKVERVSLPYVFPDGAIGVTVSKSVEAEADDVFLGVVAVDFKLASMNRFLEQIKVGKSGRAFLMSKAGEFFASNNPKSLIIEGDTSVTFVDLVHVVDVPDRFVADTGKEMLERYETFDKIFQGDQATSTSAFVSFDASVNDQSSFVYVSNLNYAENIDWLIVVILPKEDFLSNVYTANIITITTTCAFVFMSIIVALILTGLIIFPLFNLGKNMKLAANMQLIQKRNILPVLYEVHQIQQTFSSLVRALRFFKKFIPSSIIKRVMLEDEHSATRITDAENMTFMFIDIVGFSSFAETLAPSDLLQVMSAAMEAMSQIIINNNGVIDSYIGDCVFSLFGVPGVNDDPLHALHATMSAVECVKRMRELDDAWKEFGVEPLRVRVGVNSGKCCVGIVGSREKMSFSVLGNAVNLAARLEPLNKAYGSTVLISEATYDDVKDGVVCRVVDRVIVKGLTVPTNVYEPISARADASPSLLRLEAISEAVFESLKKNDFEKCFALIDESQTIEGYENDAVFMAIRQKVEGVKDGTMDLVTKMTSK